MFTINTTTLDRYFGFPQESSAPCIAEQIIEIKKVADLGLLKELKDPWRKSLCHFAIDGFNSEKDSEMHLRICFLFAATFNPQTSEEQKILTVAETIKSVGEEGEEHIRYVLLNECPPLMQKTVFKYLIEVKECSLDEFIDEFPQKMGGIALEIYSEKTREELFFKWVNSLIESEDQNTVKLNKFEKMCIAFHHAGYDTNFLEKLSIETLTSIKTWFLDESEVFASIDYRSPVGMALVSFFNNGK